MDPYEELLEFYPEVIDQMPNRFNSHEFILKLAHQHQGPYVRALAQYAGTDRPFGIVHGRLAKLLYEKFSHLVRYVGDEPSHDIFGHSSEVALWIKVKS
jgi:hypothetical protein